MCRRSWVLVPASFVLATIASTSNLAAQTTAVTTSPPNIIVPNYNGVPAGPLGGLEGNSYVARVNDPSAAWLNPAGLSRATGSQITGSAGVYQFTDVTPGTFSNAGGSVQQIPNFVGFTVKAGDLTMGAAFVTTGSWRQQTDAERIFTNGSGLPERFAYSTDAELGTKVGAFSVGYDRGRKWRVGGGLAYSYARLRSVQTSSDRIADASTLNSLLVSSHYTGSKLRLVPLAGVQVDATPSVRVGAVVRSRGIPVFGSGSVTFDGVQDAGPSSLGASLFDPSARFDYKLPFEVNGGVAFIGKRAELEFDVQGYSSISRYDMIATDQKLLLYASSPGAPPSVQQLPAPSLSAASRAMANASVGGRVQLTPSRERPIDLHFGVTTDASPVADDDKVFDRIDLIAWTVGLSGSAGKVSYAAGVNFRSGTSDTITVWNVLGGQPVQTSVHVRTIGMIYSLAYRF